ncbi:MAG TPA: type VI secretion system contractile sheath large subunit [Acetobacteraceae bacterium]|nr:type VI secretion system contractile sheath large subunit [Acetobacteraceae bacterium]
MDAASPEETARPLREGVLAGRLLGPANAKIAADLGAFLAGEGDALTLWFGVALAARIAGDAEKLRGLIDRDIAALDGLIGAQVDEILHAARLRRLEGTWRGLAWLVGGIDPTSRVRVKILNLAWPELARDLARAPEFDQSNLFRRVYEDEFGIAGGEPFGLLVVDHEARHRPVREAPTEDVEALAGLASVAAAAFAPTVLAASPALLDADSWADLALAAEPASCLRDPAHLGWRNLGAREDSRFVAVALPRLLARPPWRDDPARRDGFRYREYAPDAESRVWMSPGFAVAAATARAFAHHGWPADIRGVDQDREGGGLVTELPLEDFTTDPPGTWVRPPLELVFNDRQERALVEGGLMPLSALPFTGDAAFVAMRTLQTPQRFTGANAEAANANARISAQLHAMLCVSRFAHVIKLMGRDMTGSFLTHDEIERRLQGWLNRYVNASTSAGSEARAKAPLLAGRVQVREQPGKPGSFGCTVHLQPHYQLEDVAATFRLTTELAAMGRAA